jgi:hypothetical protein
MKTVLVVLVLTALLLAPHAGGGEGAAATLSIEARILHVPDAPALGPEIGQWHVPAGEDLAKALKRLESCTGHEAWTGSSVAGDGATLSLTLANRKRYVHDFEVKFTADGEKPEPVHSTVRDGVIADLEVKPDPDGKAAVVVAKMTIATLIRPIPTFTTKLAGEEVTIHLPEIQVTEVTRSVRVPIGRTAVFPANGTTCLLVSIGPAEKASPPPEK